MWLPYIGDLVVEEAWAGAAGVLPGLGVAGGGPAGVLPISGLGVPGGGPAGVLPCDGGPSCRARAGVPLPRRRRAQAALFTLWGRG